MCKQIDNSLFLKVRDTSTSAITLPLHLKPIQVVIHLNQFYVKKYAAMLGFVQDLRRALYAGDLWQMRGSFEVAAYTLEICG